MSRTAENQILFSVESNKTHKWFLPEKDFFSILLKSAYNFFQFMMEEFPETTSKYGRELAKIENIRRN